MRHHDPCSRTSFFCTGLPRCADGSGHATMEGFGPRQRRTQTERHYRMANRYHSGFWDRAAASWGMDAPGLLSTDPLPSPTQNAGKPPLVRKPPSLFPNKPAGFLPLRGSSPTSLPERNSTAVSNYWPGLVLLMDVSEGHGKSQPSMKAPPHS